MDVNNSISARAISDEEHRVEWSYEATKELLKLYDEKSDMLETGIISTQKKLWELTSKALAKKGYYYTAAQCENKWKALKRAYRTKLERIQKFGSYRRVCPFESEIAEILSKRPNESITRSYAYQIQAMKNEDEFFSNVNLNEPPGFTKDNTFETSDIKNVTIIGENIEEFSTEDQMEYTQPSYTVIQPETESLHSTLIDEISDLKKLITKHSKTNVQMLKEMSRNQEKILGCLEQSAEMQNKQLEIEERKVEQQDELINQMKIQNELMQNLLDKFA
ncbi:hypothetical protein NQ318_017308 [Aromia moschata]|uniref:Myb/SANT-like DNA-binding domain-containing protein n=1 Tax=Aromia moschata TaxID=1265417 RepID=A0AAV8XX66_9CUCU|nr:hypothetical protein NQ318_017308 [Aromia moschata]